MIRLLLIRHAEAVSGTIPADRIVPEDDEDGLTEAGRAQAHELGRLLAARFPTARLTTSDVRRATETATILASYLKCAAAADARLAERRCGFARGTTRAMSQKFQMEAMLFPHRVPPNGESIAQHRQRVAAWLGHFQRSLCDSSRSDPLAQAVVAHGGTIEHLQACFWDSPLSAMGQAYTSCRNAHFHLWTGHRLPDNRLVWRLEGVDLDAGALAALGN